ncbi:hypothetical protein D3C84_608450 [compost metagenome]
MHAVDRAVGGGRGGHRPQHGRGSPEACFLAFQRCGLLDRCIVQARVRLVFSPQRHRTADQEQREHAADDGPALAQILDVMPEGEHQRCGNQNDRGDLEQVAPGRGVLERMRRVDTEEATTVGTQLLDCNLAGRRPQWNHLVNALHSQRIHILCEGLWHTLPDQEQRQQQAQRQQAIERGAGHVDPEVTEGLRRFATDTAAQRNQYRQAGGRTDEVLHGQADHLAQVAQGGLTAVGLPVGVGHETDRRVEGLGPLLARQMLRVERQVVLEQQDREQQQKAREVEREQRQGILLPTLFTRRVDPGHAITAALHRPQNRRQPSALAFHHLVVEAPQKRCRHQHHGEEGKDQPIVITVHSRS